MHALHGLALGSKSPIITTSRYAVWLTTYGPFHDRNDTTKRKQPGRRFHGLVIYRQLRLLRAKFDILLQVDMFPPSACRIICPYPS